MEQNCCENQSTRDQNKHRKSEEEAGTTTTTSGEVRTISVNNIGDGLAEKIVPDRRTEQWEQERG